MLCLRCECGSVSSNAMFWFLCSSTYSYVASKNEPLVRERSRLSAVRIELQSVTWISIIYFTALYCEWVCSFLTSGTRGDFRQLSFEAVTSVLRNGVKRIIRQFFSVFFSFRCIPVVLWLQRWGVVGAAWTTNFSGPRNPGKKLMGKEKLPMWLDIRVFKFIPQRLR